MKKECKYIIIEPNQELIYLRCDNKSFAKKQMNNPMLYDRGVNKPEEFILYKAIKHKKYEV